MLTSVIVTSGRDVGPVCCAGQRSRLRRSGALAWPGGAVRTYDNLDKPIDLNRSEDTCTVTSIRLGDGPVLECVVGGALERSAPCAPPERVWPHRSRNRASQGPSVARPGRALPRPGPDFHPTRPRVRPRPAVSQSLMPPMRRGRSGRSIHVDCVCRRLRLLSVDSCLLPPLVSPVTVRVERWGRVPRVERWGARVPRVSGDGLASGPLRVHLGLHLGSCEIPTLGT